ALPAARAGSGTARSPARTPDRWDRPARAPRRPPPAGDAAPRLAAFRRLGCRPAPPRPPRRRRGGRRRRAPTLPRARAPAAAVTTGRTTWSASGSIRGRPADRRAQFLDARAQYSDACASKSDPGVAAGDGVALVAGAVHVGDQPVHHLGR